MANDFTLDYNVKGVSPTIARFHKSNAPFRAIMGPIGGAKSVACCVEIFRRCLEQQVGVDGFRRSRWVVVRNTLQQLKDTTLKTWFDWFPDSGKKGEGIGYWKVSDWTFYLEFNDVKAEILFRALDTPADVAKVLSLELTGAWLNECREIPQEIVEGLRGRLKRYPSVKMGGSNYWMLLADTNPPAIETYWWKVFEGVPLDGDDESTIVDCESFKQPSGVAHNAENLPNLPPDYYSSQTKGRSKAWIDVYIHANYALSQAGKPVYHATFRQDRHVSKKPLPIHPHLPVIVGQDFGLCYDDKTEVLTGDGWKFFKDVTEQDIVATRNPETKEFEYANINFKVARPYKGKLIGWSSTELNFLVTPEHRVPYTRRGYPDKVEFAEAQWIANNQGKHLFVDLVSNWKGHEFSPICGMTEEVYAELMGWVASDGCVEKGTNRVRISQAKQHDDLKDLLDRTPFSWSKTWITYGTSDSELHEHMDSEWGRTKKERRVAKCIRMARPHIIEIFLKAFTRGDGHIRTRKGGAIEWTIYAHSRELAGDLQELAQKCGYNSSLTVQPGSVAHIDGRRVESTSGYRVTIKRRAKRAEMYKRNYFEEEYDGMIYCLNVPYHTLYIRRNGKPSWNGNTPAGLWMQMQENGRIYILRETPSFDMGTKRYIASKFRPMHLTTFPTNPIVVIGDPSGVRRADSDESTSFKMFKDRGYYALPAATNDPYRRIKALDDIFSEYPDMEPRVLIDPACKNFIRAMRMDYRYKRKKFAAGEEYEEKPDKSAPCSHLVEGGQYGVLFLTGGRYDASAFTVYEEEFDPLVFRQGPHMPAQREGY